MTLPSDDDEIWNTFDSDDDARETNTLNNSGISSLSRGISFFIALFHLSFRLSEKAIVSLLLFLRTLFSYLATVCQVTLLTDIAKSIPRSLLWYTEIS